MLGTVGRRDRHRSLHRRRARRRPGHLHRRRPRARRLVPPPERTDGGGEDRHRTPVGPPTSRTLLGGGCGRAVGGDQVRGVARAWPSHTTIADLQAPPLDTYDVYLRLHLLSHRLVQPNTINLDGHLRPPPDRRVDAARPGGRRRAVSDAQVRARAAGTPLLVHSLDKFPRMLDYVVPSGVRVADADRVRLGAHLAEGTTVMHEGYVNFNAGTLGTAMVEGRLSQGVVMGEGSDLGGGCVRHGHAVRRRHRRSSASVSGASSAPTAASASRSATTAWSRPASTSPPAPSSPSPTAPS